MTEDLVQLYKKMADLTRPKCGQCNVPYQCCDPMYCEEAARYAAENGVMLNRTNHPRLPFMGENGCVVEPHLRPMCTAHVCEKWYMNDLAFSEEYFKLREAINEADYEANYEADLPRDF